MTVQMTRIDHQIDVMRAPRVEVAPPRRIDVNRARRVVAVALAIGSAMFAVLGIMDIADSPMPAPIEFPAHLP